MRSEIYIFHSGDNLIRKAIDSFNSKTTNLVPINPHISNKIIRLFRRITIDYIPFSKKMWVNYYLRKHKIDDNSLIIVFDSIIWSNLLKVIRNKFPNIIIVYWYWNIISDKNPINIARNYSNFVATFDKGDSQKYNIVMLGQFYWLQKKSINMQNNGFIFIGQDKGRKVDLEKLNMYLEMFNISFNCHIISPNKSILTRKNKDVVDYDIYLERLLNSEGVVDFVQRGQTGLSLRTLEAIFLNKKIITNNQAVKEYNFYNDKYIYLINDIDHIDEASFSRFLNETVPEKFYELYLKDYTFKGWIRKIESLVKNND
ncbi:MAG: hypothetical protein RBQ97_05900 [Acholeplasma sp.]|nr:hypothetical protein [Acholeplasma sp.]